MLRAIQSLQPDRSRVFTRYADEEKESLLVFAQSPGSTEQC